MGTVEKQFRLSYRRRIALNLISWLYKVTFWLDVHTAPKYNPQSMHLDHISDEEWESFYKSLGVSESLYVPEEDYNA